ncbi:ATP-binding protein [Pseudonocardia halophobica]|uniref:ATP-binding protein n=1 Tax=Pseudonocardia halophobica TaxID=29401 RepID=UPI003D944BF3
MRDAQGDLVVDQFAARGRVAFAQRTWPVDPGDLAVLRDEVRRWLDALGYRLDAVDDLVLAVNEAATNAMEHAYVLPGPDDTVDIDFWVEDDALSITIEDHGQWQTPGPAGGRGMGIPMMNHLVDTVTISHDASGTTVLLRQTLPEHSALRPAAAKQLR